MTVQNRTTGASVPRFARAALVLLAGTTVALAGAAAPEGRLTEGGTYTPSDFSPRAETRDGSVPGADQLDMAAIARAMGGGGGGAAPKGKGKDWKSLSSGFERVVSTTTGNGFYDIWVNRSTNQMLAELPRGFERQKHFFAMTVAGGEQFAGLQAGDLYVYWKRYGDDRLALVAPQIGIRSTGEQSSKDSVEMLFTDRVLLDVPVLGKGPGGQPVIDMDALLVNNAPMFFGRSARGLRAGLKEIAEAKSFPQNVELAYTVPDATGRMKTFHYSISNIKGTPGYRPREADERLGYFVTSFDDYGQYDRNNVATRYINRWHLEKADPSLKMSPPKEPIVFYVEHTVPVRYRRYVREGIEYWNEAFRKIGIDGAIEVRYQDKGTGAHMDKDPEDVRFNFIRWLNNNVATAIGPSRVNPMTGEILDADVVLTDGWIRVFTYRWNDILGEYATEGFGPETLAWLQDNPKWDPRVRFAEPGERAQMLAERARRGVTRYGGHAAAAVDPTMIGDDEYDGLAGRVSQIAGRCDASRGKAMQLATARMHLDLLGAVSPLLFAETDGATPDIPEEMLEKIKDELEKNPELLAMVPEKFRNAVGEGSSEPAAEENETEAPEPEGDRPKVEAGDLIDGVPAEFVGPMLAELVAHEVGHTLGLRHNFKGSSAYELSEINTEEFKGETPWSSSVMDYNGINIFMPSEDGSSGTTQGDFSSINIGDYDYWVIEYGYTTGDHKKVLERAGEPGLDYATDEDTWGPDPLARRYDLAKDPLDYANNQIELVKQIRGSLLDGFVEDGESWSRVRQGYGISLSEHVKAVSMMANWIGGAHVYREKKGDPHGRAPIDVVDADKQRAAMEFVIEHTFRDEAFGLTPELLEHMTIDKWWDGGNIYTDPTYSVHDTVLGVQSSAMTMLLNPDTLRRVYDNEFIVPSDEDAFTLAELMSGVADAAWSELESPAKGRYTAREPMISSMRRNLQREHLERLIDIALASETYDAASKPIATLAVMQLRDIKDRVDSASGKSGNRLDPYSRAHLADVSARIGQVLDAQYIANQSSGGAGSILRMLLGQQEAESN